MECAIATAGHPLEPRTIVLCDVGAAGLWGTEAYFTNFRGISPHAVELLLDAGICVIGTDAFGFDPPFHAMLDAFRESALDVAPCPFCCR